MRTKLIVLSYLLSLVYSASFSQNSFCGVNDQADCYQSVFFNDFFYDDFSYRFSPNNNILNNSFGKRFSTCSNSILSLNDTSSLDSLKAISNVYLVLGSQKNQGLLIENVQQIGQATFLYLNYNSVASLGFLKNNSSKNRDFNLQLAHQFKAYNLVGKLKIASNYDASSGGITDSTVSSVYSKRDLQQLNVNLVNDFLRKKFFDVSLQHKLSLYSSESAKKDLSVSVQNNYSRFSYAYNGDGTNQFYQSVFYDSVATNDSCNYNWLTNKIGLEAKLNLIKVSLHAINDNFSFQLQDSTYNYNDWSVNSVVTIDGNNWMIEGVYSKNISDNFRRNNAVGELRFKLDFAKTFFKSIELKSTYNSTNVPFVYQKQFSNHFLWNNNFESPVKQLNNMAHVNAGSNFSFEVSNTIYQQRVFLNENILPQVSNVKESVFSFGLCYNDTIKNLHIVESTFYNASNSINLPVIPFQSFTRIGYMFSLFKNNLKVEAGVSGVYNDSWFATSYSPALDDLYLQTKKKFGGLSVLNLFADFKIKSATLFLKVERLNIGWFNENSFIRDGYLAPPRTIRFGFNWPLKN